MAVSKPIVALTNAERFPLIADMSYLNKLKQDEFAPRFNFESGDRLKSHHLQQVRAYADQIRNKKMFWPENGHPDWLQGYLDWCYKTVPFYQKRKRLLDQQPTINRNDIRSMPWQFVSSDCELEDLLVYQTSGTTGAPIDVIFDPASQACWIPQLESVLDTFDIQLSKSKERSAIALICSQQSALTYASLSTYLDGAGILKINLNSGDWNDPNHRAEYLEKYNPEILTGDPFAFLSLLELRPAITPKALVSSAMKLTHGVRNKLEGYFKCPVLDIYSLTECRMVAVAEDESIHRAIRPELYLEIFDRDEDKPLPSGERGELVITGGNNPFLPLIRYRTGDFCSLQIKNNIPYLVDLQARKPVSFYKKENTFINYVDISRELSQYPLSGFTLHQNSDKSLLLKGWSNENGLEEKIKHSLLKIFGNEIRMQVTIEKIGENNALKTINYSADQTDLDDQLM